MSLKSRVIDGGFCELTQEYKKGYHNGIDIVGAGYTLAWIVAHSDGIVVSTRNNCNGFENGSYGNYVKIKHDNGYYTLYAHGAYNTVQVMVGDKVHRGEKIMYMGNTGMSYGGHLHFEVRTPNDERIDPTIYLDGDLPNNVIPKPTLKYNVGDNVNITGVYTSSVSYDRLTPAVSHGKITKIVDAPNPYLLNDGLIGWVNDECISGRHDEGSLLTLVKMTIRGDFGNGEERKARLGGRYNEVQNQVNLNYIHGTTSWNSIRIY